MPDKNSCPGTCPEHEFVREQLKFVKTMIDDSVPELKGLGKDVIQCVSDLSESFKTLNRLERLLNQHDERLRKTERFIVGYEAARQAIDDTIDKKFRFWGIVISALLVLFSFLNVWVAGQTWKQEKTLMEQRLTETVHQNIQRHYDHVQR